MKKQLLLVALLGAGIANIDALTSRASRAKDAAKNALGKIDAAGQRFRAKLCTVKTKMGTTGYTLVATLFNKLSEKYAEIGMNQLKNYADQIKDGHLKFLHLPGVLESVASTAITTMNSVGLEIAEPIDSFLEAVTNNYNNMSEILKFPCPGDVQ